MRPPPPLPPPCAGGVTPDADSVFFQIFFFLSRVKELLLLCGGPSEGPSGHRDGAAGPRLSEISSEAAAAGVRPLALSDFYLSLGNCRDENCL